MLSLIGAGIYLTLYGRVSVMYSNEYVCYDKLTVPEIAIQLFSIHH